MSKTKLPKSCILMPPPSDIKKGASSILLMIVVPSVKVFAVKLNALRNGKHSKTILRGSQIARCSGCVYRDFCDSYECGSLCKITIRQVKKLNELGLKFDVKEIANNYLMSLQRFAMEMHNANRELINLRRWIQRIRKQIRKLEKDSDTQKDTRLLIQNSRERMTLIKTEKDLRKEEHTKEMQCMNMELDYMTKLCEFKKMTLGNKIIVQSQPKVDVIREEMRTAYKLFGGKDNVNDFLVKE